MHAHASSRKEVLLVAMDSDKIAAMADEIHEMFSRSGVDVVRCEYSHQYLPMPPSNKNAAKRISFFDNQGIDGVSRLSHEEYIRLCGDDIDFSAIDINDAWLDGWLCDMEHLSPESVRVQRLRGSAWKLEGLLRTVNPSAVVVPHGLEVVSKILAAKGLKLGIPVIMLENGFVPGHIYLELQGQHFYRDFCRIDSIYRSGKMVVEPKAAMESALARKEKILGNVSKYKQTTNDGDRLAFEAFRRKFKKILFVPEQVPFDANIFVNLIGKSKIGEMYDAVRKALPPDMGLLVKRHPQVAEMADKAKSAMTEADNILVVKDLSLAEIFRARPAVATISSNVGLEAALCGLPVLTLGAPIYSGKGFTLEWDGESALAPLFDELFQFVPDYDKVAIFYGTIMREVLFDLATFSFDDFEGFCAPDEFTAKPDPRLPFWAPRASKSEEYVQLRRDFADLYYKNYSFPEIMRFLGKAESQSAWHRLDSGERQTAETRANIERKHMERYAFASRLLPPDGLVLDAGCGVGYGTNFLAERTGARVKAFDASGEAIAFAEKHYARENIEFIAASAGSFLDNFPVGHEHALDMIVAYEFLEYLPGSRYFVGELKKRLKEDGVLVCSVPNRRRYPIENNKYHIRHYDPQSLLELAAPAPDEHCAIFGQGERGIECAGAGMEFNDWRYLVFALSRDRAKIDKLAEAAPFFSSLGKNAGWPNTEDMRGTEISLFPFDRIPARSKVVIYGAGRFGYRYYKQATSLGYCDIVMVVDAMSAEFDDPCGVRIHPVGDIRDVECDYVVLAAKSGKMREEMKVSLLNIGVPPTKIIAGATVKY